MEKRDLVLQKENNRIYYPHLTGLRAIAVLLVFFHHYNQILKLFKIEGIPISFLNYSGEIGVLLFFVLSGFLITILLLNEERRFEKINIKNFYIRRILRIWPLYYLMVILGFFIFPYLSITYLSDYTFDNKDFIMFFFFSANYVLLKGIVVPGVSPLWTVCVEEYFYLIWPWFIRFKKFFCVFIGIIFLFPIIKYILNLYDFDIYYIDRFFKLFPFEGMVSGGVFAYFFFHISEKKRKRIFNKYVQLLFFSIFLFLFLFIGVNFPLSKFFYIIVFSYLISNFSLNKNNILYLEFKYLNFIGEISYGIYLFHSFIIFINVFLFKSLFDSFYLLSFKHILFSLFILGITILVSKLVFIHFEMRFLKLKDKFMVLKTPIINK